MNKEVFLTVMETIFRVFIVLSIMTMADKLVTNNIIELNWEFNFIGLIFTTWCVLPIIKDINWKETEE